MTAMIRYELKKIFQSKLFIALFVLALIGMIAFTAHSVNQYQSGVRGQYRLSIPQSKKIPETFVSDATIGILRDKLAAFEENDNIYEDYGIWKANTANSIIPRTIYHGKYEGTQSPTYTPPVIKDEYLPEYFKLFCPVDEYDHKKTDAAQERESAKGYDTTQKMYRVYTAYAEQTEKELKEGFTVGYDYGWENFFSSLSADTGILLAAVVIFGLCGVFTGEYASAADSLLLSSRRGRARLAGAKIVASLLFAGRSTSP